MARLLRITFRVRQVLRAYRRTLLFFCLAVCVPGTTRAQWNPLSPVVSVQQESDGVRFTLQTGVMRLQVCSSSIIQVRYSPVESSTTHPDLAVIKDNWSATKWEMRETNDAITLSTSELKAVVSRK